MCLVVRDVGLHNRSQASDGPWVVEQRTGGTRHGLGPLHMSIFIMSTCEILGRDEDLAVLGEPIVVDTISTLFCAKINFTEP